MECSARRFHVVQASASARAQCSIPFRQIDTLLLLLVQFQDPLGFPVPIENVYHRAKRIALQRQLPPLLQEGWSPSLADARHPPLVSFTFNITIIYLPASRNFTESHRENSFQRSSIKFLVTNMCIWHRNITIFFIPVMTKPIRSSTWLWRFPAGPMPRWRFH